MQNNPFRYIIISCIALNISNRYKDRGINIHTQTHFYVNMQKYKRKKILINIIQKYFLYKNILTNKFVSESNQKQNGYFYRQIHQLQHPQKGVVPILSR